MRWVEKGKEFVRPHLWNARGWSSKEKLLVIQSDDWGADRNAHPEGLEALRALGVRVDACHYMLYDGLALDEDLEGLFGVMEEFRDRDGNPPVMTANVLMANPDFERIRAGGAESGGAESGGAESGGVEQDGAEHGGFQEYFSIGLEETFERKRVERDGYRQGLSLWREGMDAGVFFPQLHGMEHVQVPRWMRLLQDGAGSSAVGKVFRTAFDAGIYGVSRSTLEGIAGKNSQIKPKSVQAALEVDSAEDKAVVMDRISQAPAEFRRVFGYSSASFIAPNYTWFPEVESMLVQEGVRFMQGATRQWIVGGGSGSSGPGSGGSGSNGPGSGDSGNAGFGIQVERRFMGERYASGLVGQIRNVHFEPTEWWYQHAWKNSSGSIGSFPIGSYPVDSDSVKRALHQIRTAFLWRKPAVMSTHRVNYSGVMDPALRDWNLAQLRTLLEHILYLWPDVKFVTSEELGNRML